MTKAPASTPERRSTLGYIALAAAVVSATGMAGLILGDAAGIKGAYEGEEGSLVFDVAWAAFSLGAIVALVAGIVALVVGSRRGDGGTRRDGTLALAYVAVAIILAFIGAAIGE